MAFEWDVGTGSMNRSENAAQILGFDSKQPLSVTEFHSRIHPDDSARHKALVYGVRPDSPSYAITFRFIRPDGREVWLEKMAKAEFDAEGHYVRLKGLVRDITERKRFQQHQDLLISELDHRVKNALARVVAVAMSTRQSNNSMDQFIKALDGRLHSMADAHELLSQSRWHGAGITELVQRQLAPYTSSANTAIQGPDLKLTAPATEAVAMVLQKLVTNALKHGALSTPDGRVSVSWHCRLGAPAATCLVIEWRETGGPLTVTPPRSGYGTTLIRELIPHELGGSVDLVFAPEGLGCLITIPL